MPEARSRRALPFNSSVIIGSAALVLSLGACSVEPGGANTTAVGGPITEIGLEHAALSVEAPDTLAFRLDLAGQDFRLALELGRPPTTANYQSFRRRADGALVPLPATLQACSYRGRAEPVDSAASSSADDSGFASVSACTDATGLPAGQAVLGVVRAAGRFWRLSPDASDRDASDGIRHWALPLQRSPSGVGTEQARRTTLHREPESPAPRLEFREGTPEETKYVELVVVSDAARVAQSGGQTEATGLRFVETMNALLADSGLTPRLRVTLRAQVLFEEDPYVPAFSGDEVDHESLINEFLGWANQAELPPHDEHMLLSGLDFLGGTVGFAGLDVACTAESNGFIVEAGDAGGGFPVLSAVHELGHTLGMNHDDGVACSETGFIMAAVGCGNCPTDNRFSSCSLEDFEAYLEGPAYAQGARCADDVPSAGGVASCGDAVVQAGEECDCGADDCGDIDPCCNGATCQLEAGADCSDFNDGCCQGCEVVPAAADVVCRARRSECDFEETCTGLTKSCPADRFEAAAGACEDERGNPGACYLGECRSRTTQCEQIAEQQGFDDVGAPGPRCQASCNQVVCGNGPTGCVTIGGPTVIDGVLCDSGQCVDQTCVTLVDQCPNDPAKSEPGACGCNASDSDQDADETADCVDACPADADKQAPGACGCGTPDVDTDTDGRADCDDGCPNDGSKQEPGPCGCGNTDLDTDGDATPDCTDECPEDAQSSLAGACGCGVPALDGDGDGTADCNDACPEDATRSALPCSATNGSVRGSCAVEAPAPRTRLGWLALLAVPLLRRRRHAASQRITCQSESDATSARAFES